MNLKVHDMISLQIQQSRAAFISKSLFMMAKSIICGLKLPWLLSLDKSKPFWAPDPSHPIPWYSSDHFNHSSNHLHSKSTSSTLLVKYQKSFYNVKIPNPQVGLEDKKNDTPYLDSTCQTFLLLARMLLFLCASRLQDEPWPSRCVEPRVDKSVFRPTASG